MTIQLRHPTLSTATQSVRCMSLTSRGTNVAERHLWGQLAEKGLDICGDVFLLSITNLWDEAWSRQV